MGACQDAEEGAMTGEEYYWKVSRGRKYLETPEAFELLQAYMRECGLDGWKATIYKREPVVQGARCYVESKLIWINEWIVRFSTPAKLRETILHEIAHALVPYDFNHGEAWEHKALELGVSAEHVRKARAALEEAL
jgi:hypothetical protein